MSKAISRRDFLKVSGAVGAAGLLAACGRDEATTQAAPSKAVTDSWHVGVDSVTSELTLPPVTPAP